MLAGCGSRDSDPWREVAIPAAAGDTTGACGSVGVMDVPAGWRVEPPNRTYFSGKEYRLTIDCVITTGDSADGTLEVYERTEPDPGTTPTPRQFLQDTVDPANDPTDVDIRDALVGGLASAEVTWHTRYQNRAFTHRVESIDLTMVVIATGAKDAEYDEVLLPAYLLAKKSIRD
ncbi:hypothetical protein Aglo02_00500 [Actinokineospora globicatena]|nr:hypothetical protein Aglo02_00500 [Actinokineospora globicatena]